MTGSPQVARAATCAVFILNGFVLGTWIVNIPAVEHRVGVGHAVFGWLLLVLGVGSFTGMQVAGPLADRLGARVVVPVSAALCSAALVLPGLAVNAWTLGVALLTLGFANGCLNVSMNTHAVQVERAYNRPVMSGFHAGFSIGGVLAALVAARAIGWGWPTVATFTGTAVVGLLVAALCVPALLGRENREGTPLVSGGVRERTPRRIWALAALAMILMLCEGVAYDWSALGLRDVLDASASSAAWAYGAFSVAMTIGRLLTDRVTARFGPVAVVRFGASSAAAGLAVVVVSPSIAAAVTGWAIFGVGLSGCVPQLFSAAGHADPRAAGANVARVVGLGYLGMLAGPAVIGPLTRLAPLNVTFLLPVALCVIAACAAPLLRPRQT
ncbi:MFS transporter [Streptomyces sp. SID3343]|uniref:MFS transporter n=1 Tax=Streptomyces sp. SID3343 TaxID=2690260 RepID=UPI00136A88A9|nr:MFS transporter [Streptomyces sp. SID3343]MYW05567.1 MFS transporter [Streptomyces sp. SID3343]